MQSAMPKIATDRRVDRRLLRCGVVFIGCNVENATDWATLLVRTQDEQDTYLDSVRHTGRGTPFPCRRDIRNKVPSATTDHSGASKPVLFCEVMKMLAIHSR